MDIFCEVPPLLATVPSSAWLLEHGSWGQAENYIQLPMEQGVPYIFDDTYFHASVNERTGRRVNLFLEVPRHDFPWPRRA